MTDVTVPPAATVDDSRQRMRAALRVPKSAALIAVVGVEIILFSVLSPEFLNWDNFLNILTAIAVIGIVAIPGTLLIVSGQFDLSVGSTTALAGVVLAVVTASHGLAVGIVAAAASGIAVGLINGFLVTVVGVNALITTLGMLSVARGMAQVISEGTTVNISGFGGLGLARPFLNIPLAVVILVGVAILFMIIMRYTVFGRRVYAIGANPIAARHAGIGTTRVIMILFLLSGLACVLAAMILDSQLASASPSSALGLELAVITAVVLGGATLSGGEGTVFGTALGLLIVGVLNNGLVLTGVDPFWQNVAQGSLLIAAVSFDRLRARFADSR